MITQGLVTAPISLQYKICLSILFYINCGTILLSNQCVIHTDNILRELIHKHFFTVPIPLLYNICLLILFFRINCSTILLPSQCVIHTDIILRQSLHKFCLQRPYPCSTTYICLYCFKNELHY